MRRTLSLMLLLGLWVSIVKADDKPASRPRPSNLIPEKDSRVAKRPGAQTQKIGVLAYYPTVGGGLTFSENGKVAFYALPYLPVTSKHERTVNRQVGKKEVPVVVAILFHATIGPSKLPLGSYAIYRSELMADGEGGFLRQYIPIAMWSRDTAGGQFRLSLMVDDPETRLKLKSIIPVLESAEHRR
jgi:hypothetical protein